MYIGGTDIHAMHHLVSEVLDNSMDEVVSGHANKVDVKLLDNTTIEITDNGRGIPVDKHPKFKLPAVEVILTTLHSGGKFSNKNYQTSGGLHGVGVSVVNALSKKLELEIARDKKFYTQSYSKGIKKNKLKTISRGSIKKGTKIKFTPDDEIFEKENFDSSIIYNMAKAKAYLIPNVEINWSCPKSLIKKNVPTQDKLHYAKGIHDYLSALTSPSEPIFDEEFYFKVNIDDNGNNLEAVINWFDAIDPINESYCNTIKTPLGGTHENGFKNGMFKAFKEFSKIKYERKASQIIQEDLFGSSASILSIFIENPEFQGQTKEKLSSIEPGKKIETKTKQVFEQWLAKKQKQQNNYFFMPTTVLN